MSSSSGNGIFGECRNPAEKRLETGTALREILPMNTRPSWNRTGFTLVELLLVIAVIGLLILLLMPALGRAKQESYCVRCQASLKDLAVRHTAFMDEHQGGIVPAVGTTAGESTWRKNMAPYMTEKGRDYCINNKPSLTDAAIGFDNTDYAVWGVNQLSSTVDDRQLRKSAHFKKISTIPLFVDFIGGLPNAGALWDGYLANPTYAALILKHPRKTFNIIWLDGHCDRKIKATSIELDPDETWKAP